MLLGTTLPRVETAPPTYYLDGPIGGYLLLACSEGDITEVWAAGGAQPGMLLSRQKAAAGGTKASGLWLRLPWLLLFVLSPVPLAPSLGPEMLQKAYRCVF